MRYRTLGKTGYEVSTVSFGAWAAGGDFGPVDDAQTLDTMRSAVEAGVNFFDTADVYGDGHSERMIAQLKKSISAPIIVATKAGRRLQPHQAEGYVYDKLAPFVDRSLKNLQSDCLDLLQLHCPPTDVYYDRRAFEALERLREQGKIAHYGVSVERCEEGLKALEFPGVASVQIIYNIFRPRPAELLFRRAQQCNVGIIARVPLASGLLSGKMTRERTFAKSDHRHYNRHGEAFDPGETFSGVDFDAGLAIAEQLQDLMPRGASLAQVALAWILMDPAVSCAIPGAKSPEQAKANAAAAELEAPSREFVDAAAKLYRERLHADIHHRW